MKNVIGVINLGKPHSMLDDLTRNRSIASVPFGGRYRLIDFTLSNMANTGISKVAVFTLNKSRSLMDHLGSGKEWQLDRKIGGLFVLPPAIEFPTQEYKGDLQNFHGHIDYFNRSKEEYVIVCRSHMICNVNYAEALQFHIDSEADITMLYNRVDPDTVDLSNCYQVEVDEHQRVRGMSSDFDTGNVYMETFIINKSLLVELIEQCAENEQYDLTESLLIQNINNVSVHAFQHQGHLSIINCTTSYYNQSMRLLDPEVWKGLFFQPGLVYTKIKDEPPTKYIETADVRNSLIANGCIVQGQVENSILFRGVKVAKGAVIRNSIIMQECEIGADAVVENMILDKEVCIKRGQSLIGNATEPVVINKRSTI
ncbi:glucose-1-phosphate adenylyltransferase subunit GlgD [Tumebacillus sp. ITR2]|uniref:Glucose-1-phosphate adenylyltransferase subunit GlgD n=1 Tax=Tumebacillus amylolyticus TaxID=2801339 RepID=A0ABS1JAY1_9BACL|nr:glucose-1-phosphate adenylyltransferase subunit GlgD [Tumebacillus amylolyticus]MBL0387419.1 glucose-1-phosphate adenylyltransferase subunit GlgD [Tumebacillus amylolyticus]